MPNTQTEQQLPIGMTYRVFIGLMDAVAELRVEHEHALRKGDSANDGSHLRVLHNLEDTAAELAFRHPGYANRYSALRIYE